MNAAIFKGLIVALIAGALTVWVTFTVKLIKENTTLENTLIERDRIIKDLRLEITKKDKGDKEIDRRFDDLDEEMSEMICEARGYTLSAAPIVLTQSSNVKTVEVVKYIDRISKCPTTDESKAESFNPTVAAMRPTNESLQVRTLDNSWKAYCLATDYEDEACLAMKP